LTETPKQLPPKWFYDDRGSALFDEITRLPEYYLTRCEREILADRAGEIAGITQADTLVELGSGTSEKTRLLLDAFSRGGTLRRFVPFDVNEGVLRDAAQNINDDYRDIEVHAVVGDFERHVPMLPDDGRRLIAFLGSTIGNLVPAQRASFLRELAATMHQGDAALIGFDLVKDTDRLVAAYDDPGGVTAAFNGNVLHVLNREVRANFDHDAFEHVARFDPDEEWMEMGLRSLRSQHVVLDDLGLRIAFDDGEQMQTEISAKFRRPRIETELGSAGLRLEQWWTDAADDFGLALILSA
jgi:L-histidine N-alpha-methyltransferase